MIRIEQGIIGGASTTKISAIETHEDRILIHFNTDIPCSESRCYLSLAGSKKDFQELIDLLEKTMSLIPKPITIQEELERR